MALVRLLRRTPHIVFALLYFTYELVVANARLAWDVITPGLPTTAGIIQVPTAARTDAELFLVANAISMTPGTLTLEIDKEGGWLFVHTLYAEDRGHFLDQIAGLERVLLKAVRG